MSDLIFSYWKKFAKADRSESVVKLQLLIYFSVGFVSQM